MKEIEQSYLRQVESEQQMKLPHRYTRPESIDNWRHTRMLDLTRPIWQSFPEGRWITVKVRGLHERPGEVFIAVLAVSLTAAIRTEIANLGKARDRPGLEHDGGGH